MTTRNEKNVALFSDSKVATADNNKVDNKGVLPSATEESHKKERISFRDKVVGGSATNFTELVAQLDGDRLGKVFGKQGDSIKPRVTFTDETRAVFSQPFQEAIVIKVLDK
ncbi:hypothetical protein PIB30_103691, partial [Stylosanthes scabra]|nr:hypothetical protein [Stylosanthes scabra]